MKDKFIMILTIALSIFGLLFFLRRRRGYSRDGVYVGWSRTSFDSSKCGDIANFQFEAMRSFGTDNKQLFDSLKGLNKNELIEVNRLFDKRAYMGIGGFFGTGQKLNLMQWYYKELNNSEKKQMYDIWKHTNVSGVELLNSLNV